MNNVKNHYMTEPETPQEYLEWAEKQESITQNMLEEIGFYEDYKIGPITIHLNEDGERVIPKRDVTDTIKHGQPLD